MHSVRGITLDFRILKLHESTLLQNSFRYVTLLNYFVDRRPAATADKGFFLAKMGRRKHFLLLQFK